MKIFILFLSLKLSVAHQLRQNKDHSCRSPEKSKLDNLNFIKTKLEQKAKKENGNLYFGPQNLNIYSSLNSASKHSENSKVY